MAKANANTGTTAAPAPTKPWKADQEIYDTVKDLIAQYHPGLIMCVDQIAILFKEKASMKGDVPVLATTAKASPLLGILSDVDYQFVITIAADQWNELSDRQKIALLDRQLCACKAVVNDDGSTKYSVAPPDVFFYADELTRHGFWQTTGASVDQKMLDHIFGA